MLKTDDSLPFYTQNLNDSLPTWKIFLPTWNWWGL